MPVIDITMGKFSEEKKAQLIEQLTTTAAEITNLSVDHFTVLIHELDLENLGVGGKTVKALRAGQ